MEIIAPATSCGCHTSCAASEPDFRPALVNRALRLEYLTVVWNVVEGIVAVTAALLASSVAILGFGIDSLVECASALVMIWRLRAERDHRMSGARLKTMDHRARRLIAGSLFLLAAYITFDAAQTLWTGDKPAFSTVGVALLALSIAVMLWLARASLPSSLASLEAKPSKPTRSKQRRVGGCLSRRSSAWGSTACSAGGGPTPPLRSLSPR
jgi:hypothetical protein